MSPAEVEVHQDVDRLDELMTLYSALLTHHANLPDVPAALPLERSWRLRRTEYRTWLEDDGFVAVARREGRVVGYAVVSIATGPDDMWVTGDRIAEIQTLSVGPADRGAGVGKLLLDAIDDELQARGVRDVQIAVVATNADALRLYQRRGFRPRLVVLSNYTHES